MYMPKEIISTDEDLPKVIKPEATVAMQVFTSIAIKIKEKMEEEKRETASTHQNEKQELLDA